ncbi:hypothetical protein HOH87_07065 [bacterium]|jgi:hypothetical protein|nr:hypothetical protein [bacterium]
MDLFFKIFIIFFAVSIGVSNLFRLYFAHKNRKEQDLFMKTIDKEMEYLTQQLQQRGMDMQESLDVINKEYTDTMSDISTSRQADTRGTLAEKQAMANHLKKTEGSKAKGAAPSPPKTDDSTSK